MMAALHWEKDRTYDKTYNETIKLDKPIRLEGTGSLIKKIGEELNGKKGKKPRH